MEPEPGQAFQGQRTLAAIVFSDVVNFSGRVSADEEHTLQLAQRDMALMTRYCQQFEGRVLKTTGDGLLMYFTSAVQAVACALEIQKAIAAAAETLPAKDVLQHRIGIHLGDVFVSESDVMGDGVNIAARLQSEADPGGICMSQIVYDVVKKRLALKATYLGPRELKHIQEAIPVYQILLAAHSKTAELVDFLENEDSSISMSQEPVSTSFSLPSGSVITLSDSHRKSLEQLLAEFIGPIAAIVLQQTLKQTHTAKSLLETLAARLPEPARADFRAKAKPLLLMAAQAEPTTPTTPTPAAIEPEPTVTSGFAADLDPDFIHRCEQELARVIGPIAPLLVKRTLSQTPNLSRSGLVEALAQHLPDDATSTTFRQSLLSVS